ncbi:MAG: hypothetical protein ABSB30_14520 [Terracidiphilus sp.]
MARVRKAAIGRSRGTGTQAQAVNPGKAKLIAAVDKQVGEQSNEMAKKLIEGFLAGNVTSIKLLFELADGHIDCENMPELSRVCSYAESLASERQLKGDEAEAVAETEKGETAS